MTQPALTAADLMAWNRTTADRWRSLLSSHPEALVLSCDIAGVKSVAEFLQHIVAVELRYAERLASLPATDYAAIPFDSVAAIYATHDRALSLFEQQLASTVDWAEPIDFVTRSMGPARSTRQAVLFHALLHAIRHYAQLATLLRQHNIKPDWPMDYLFLHMEKL
ncbi:MAG TPA: DinB family protein [Edaphobacter sp.]|nr:DinB family protein [Edaphobacter sp.]